MTDTKWKLRPR